MLGTKYCYEVGQNTAIQRTRGQNTAVLNLKKDMFKKRGTKYCDYNLCLNSLTNEAVT